MKDYSEASQKERAELIDARGAQRTESLFVETIQYETAKRYTPLYSLRDYENKGYPSAYQVYINSVDENEAALKLLGSLAHWRKLCRLKWFREGRVNTGFEGVESWRADMAARDATTAKKILLKQCEEGNVTAARAIEKMSRDTKTNKKVPSKTGGSNSKEDSTIVELIKRHSD